MGEWENGGVGLMSIILAAVLAAGAVPAAGQSGDERHALLIGGLGGTDEFAGRFQQHLLRTRSAFVDRFAFPEAQVTVLAEPGAAERDFVDGTSAAENIRGWFEDRARQLGADDEVYVILFGHGSYDGEAAYLNIPGRDLSSTDYAALVGEIGAGRLVFVNTASASAPFVEALSGSDRIVISATRTGTQRNVTSFPAYFVEALTGAAADADRDGNLSVYEVFRHAVERTNQSFEEEGYVASEQALIADDGAGRGYRLDELEEAAAGGLASVTFLQRAEREVGASAEQLRERQQLEREIAELKRRKQDLRESEYYGQLETLFVRLARLNEQIEMRANEQ